MGGEKWATTICIDQSLTSIESPKLTRKPHQATLEKHSESQIEKKKWKLCLYIDYAMHKVHTHLLTEESLGCQPLLFVVHEGKVSPGMKATQEFSFPRMTRLWVPITAASWDRDPWPRRWPFCPTNWTPPESAKSSLLRWSSWLNCGVWNYKGRINLNSLLNSKRI